MDLAESGRCRKSSESARRSRAVALPLPEDGWLPMVVVKASRSSLQTQRPSDDAKRTYFPSYSLMRRWRSVSTASRARQGAPAFRKSASAFRIQPSETSEGGTERAAASKASARR